MKQASYQEELEKDDMTKIWQQFIAGDDRSYTCIYQTYIQILYRYGLCFTSDEDLIKDCIQDLFVYLYANRTCLDKDCNVKVYLLISLKNNLCKHLVRNSHFGSIAEDYPFLSELSVEEQFINNETTETDSQRVATMLAVLPPRQREILYYRYIQELPMEEICRLMALNYQSAQNLIQRSLKKLRETYRGDPTLLLFFALLTENFPAKF